MQVFGIEELLLGPKNLSITPEVLGTKCQGVLKWGVENTGTTDLSMPTWIWQDGDPMGHPKFAELCQEWKEHVQPGVPHKHGLFEKCSGPTIDELVFMLRNVSSLVVFSRTCIVCTPPFPPVFSTPPGVSQRHILVIALFMFAADA
jgi:hypothetical protein